MIYHFECYEAIDGCELEDFTLENFSDYKLRIALLVESFYCKEKSKFLGLKDFLSNNFISFKVGYVPFDGMVDPSRYCEE